LVYAKKYLNTILFFFSLFKRYRSNLTYVFYLQPSLRLYIYFLAIIIGQSGVIFNMNNNTKTYFTSLFVALAVFSLIKLIININKPKTINPPIVIEQQEQVKKAEPVIKQSKHIVVKKGLQTSGNWRSR